MSNLNPLLERNEAFAGTDARDGLAPMPRHQVVVVTCMDGRVDPAHIMGVELGDALVIRNSGGRVTEDVLHEVAFIGAVTEMMSGGNPETFEVAVIHHTSCGSGLLANPEFRATITANTGADDQALAESAVTNPFVSVKHDVELLARWSHLPANVTISGHVYDVDTGLIATVAPPSEPRG